WIGEHFLKSQYSAVVVFGSGRIRNCNNGNRAGDHDVGSWNAFMRAKRPHLRAVAFGIPNRYSLQRVVRWHVGHILSGHPEIDMRIATTLFPTEKVSTSIAPSQ